MATYSYYQRKPENETKRKKKKHRQCIWEDCYGNRCENHAVGMFFCKTHLLTATRIDSCGYDGNDYCITD